MIKRIKRRNRYATALAALLFTIYGTLGMMWLTSWVSEIRDWVPILLLPLVWFLYLALLGFIWHFIVLRSFFTIGKDSNEG